MLDVHQPGHMQSMDTSNNQKQYHKISINEKFKLKLYDPSLLGLKLDRQC
jgi:hypothetical protein